MAEVVLDASALLALLNAEAGSDEVAASLPGARISAVNVAEVVGKLAEAGAPEEEILEILEGLGLEIRAAGLQEAMRAGLMRPETRSLGLSLGDRFCLALGRELGAPVLTADRSWVGVPGVAVKVLR